MEKNEASNPADLNEWTQRFDMEAEKPGVILFIYKALICPLPQETQGAPVAISELLFPFTYQCGLEKKAKTTKLMNF